MLRAFFDRPWLVASCLFVVNFLIRLYNIDYGSYNLDEAMHVWYAQKDFDDIIERASRDPNPPLFSLIMSVWIKVFGITELGTRLFSVTMSAFSASALYLLCVRFINRNTAVIASLLFLVSNVQLYFSHDARPYTFLCLFAILSYYQFLAIQQKANWKTGGIYLGVSTIMLFAHPTGLFNFFAQGAYALLRIRSKTRAFVITITAQIVSLGLYYTWYSQTIYYKDAGTTWIAPPNWQEFTRVYYELAGNALVLGIVLVLLGLTLILLLCRKPKPVPVFWLLLMWGILPLLANAAYSHLLTPVFNERYNLTVSLGILLLVAFLIDYLFRHKPEKIMAVVFTTMVAASSLNFFSTTWFEWREAVAHVKSLHTENTVITISPWYERVTFAYYWDKRIYEDAYNTDQLLWDRNIIPISSDPINERITLGNYDHLLFLNSHFTSAMQEENLLYLTTNYRLQSIKEFSGIRAYEFNLTENPVELITILDSFEDPNSTDFITTDQAFSGNKVSSTGPTSQFSGTIVVTANEIPKGASFARISVWRNGNAQGGATLVSSFEKYGEILQYDSFILPYGNSNGWSNTAEIVMVPQLLEPGYQHKLYVWNTSSEEIWIDDLSVTYYK